MPPQQLLDPAASCLLSSLSHLPPPLQESAAAAVVEHVSGAMTNLVYRCSSPATATTSNATVIVRVFGQGGKLFSQKDERNIFLLASELGLGPKCLVSSPCASPAPLLFLSGRCPASLPVPRTVAGPLPGSSTPALPAAPPRCRWNLRMGGWRSSCPGTT